MLTGASEYARRQIHTSLLAVPHRLVLLTGKAAAYLVVAALTSLATVAACTGAAAWVLPKAHSGIEAGPLLGAAAYLVMIGVVGLGVAMLLRSLVAALTAMLTLVMIVSPLLASRTEHARWLPDQAGSLLYSPDADPVLTTGTGALVLAAWIGLVCALAATEFVRLDA